jgi:hypothetical protein
MILAALLACADKPAVTTEGARAATLLYSGNVDGEIEPCG